MTGDTDKLKSILKNLKIKFYEQFFEKVALLEVKEFHGLHDDLKII